MEARRFRTAGALVCLIAGGWAVARAQSPAVAPTRVVAFAVPSTLPELVQTGTCGASLMAWFRVDAMACTVEKTNLDPCFKTSRADYALCVPDPRRTETMALVAFRQGFGADVEELPQRVNAWFFELADGTTCQPLPIRGRELDGLWELYKCKWGSSGEADAVLGDLDSSEPVWTIRKVSINKKTEPQTIKSMTVATVKTVWR